MKYEKARAEVVLFDNSDVITTSPVCYNPFPGREFDGDCILTNPGSGVGCSSSWKVGALSD